jgi:alkanesulfonate monooxygenase SsuD/methylene tetrahydromethanopterin reductase-like flavin-dependent oxidoreductase (luciferase family)
VEGLFLNAPDPQAVPSGVDAVFLADGPLGDPIVLAAGLAGRLGDRLPDLLFGVRISLGPQPHRHPTIVAREMTTLDHVTGGRTVLAFMGPFNQDTSEAVSEAISLCRDMWSEGVGVSEGPRYPAVRAIIQPLPVRLGGPPIALDLTAESAPPPDAALLRMCDLVLMRADAMPPDALPPGVEVCWIRDE